MMARVLQYLQRAQIKIWMNVQSTLQSNVALGALNCTYCIQIAVEYVLISMSLVGKFGSRPQWLRRNECAKITINWS